MSVVDNLMRVGIATFDFAFDMQGEARDIKTLEYGDILSRAMASASIMLFAVEIMVAINNEMGDGEHSLNLNNKVLELVNTSLKSIFEDAEDGNGNNVYEFMAKDIGLTTLDETVH